MNRAYDVIVVGAGILGASTAYHLKRNEVKRVALFERRGVRRDRQKRRHRPPGQCQRKPA